MDLNTALKEFEAVESNLSKLEKLWDDIESMLPKGGGIYVDDEKVYMSLKRKFVHIAKQMPMIGTFQLDVYLLDPDEIAQGSLDCLELGEFEVSLLFNGELHKQGEILCEYRFLFDLKRRDLARQSVNDRVVLIDSLLTGMTDSAENLAQYDEMPQDVWEELKSEYKSIDALLGSSLRRGARWGDMARHLSFGLRQDYEDIKNFDWPVIKKWLENSLYAEDDALPVSVQDIDDLVKSNPKGKVATELDFSNLSPSDFERLIYNIISLSTGYENPEWLTHTNAPDRGRDLSVYRVISDQLAGIRRERIIFGCKHTSSVNLPDVATLKEQMKLWKNPKIDELIVTTTGRFTTDAIDFVEENNSSNSNMRITMWPNSHLEKLLATRPELIANFRLRN